MVVRNEREEKTPIKEDQEQGKGFEASDLRRKQQPANLRKSRPVV